MSQLKLVALILLLFVFTSNAFAKVKVCKPTGFFDHYFEQVLTLSGNCDDQNKKVVIFHGPGGVLLKGFGTNPPIPLKLVSDTKATATKIVQFGQGDHNGEFRIVDGGAIEFEMENQTTGGRCSGIARGGRGCLYTATVVTGTGCPPPGIFCAPCEKPCPNYGTATFFVQGTPTATCRMTLGAPPLACANCAGAPAITPKQ